ncbi:MAG: MBL fold metallo-hydrolase [Clostridia bacterium]|nr:MBL fold metallo-hydrolase [Clostridia bacterium]
MLLKTFKGLVGAMDTYTNTYVVYDEKTNEGILIDVADNVDKIYNFTENSRITLKYVVLTHCHGDHTLGIKELKRLYPKVKIIIHKEDARGLTDDEINRCSSIGREPNFTEADLVVRDGDVLEFGETKAQIIHTPGHTKGGICLLIEDALFSGDTLFKGTTGRTDLPTGSRWEMADSVKKLLQLPENTIVYPGHGATTIIGEEK